MVCGVYRADKDAVEGVVKRGEGEGELAEAAEREGGFGVDVERGGGEGERELGGEEELEGELGFAAAAFGDEFSDGVAGEAAAEEAVEDWTAEGELLGWEEEGVEETFWVHERERERETTFEMGGSGKGLWA